MTTYDKNRIETAKVTETHTGIAYYRAYYGSVFDVDYKHDLFADGDTACQAVTNLWKKIKSKNNSFLI